MTPKTTAKKAEPDTSTVQTTEVKEAPAKTTVRKTRTTAKKTTEKPAAEKKLLLSTGYVVSALDDHSVVAIRKFIDESVCLCQAADSLNLLVTGMLITPADVFINAA